MRHVAIAVYRQIEITNVFVNTDIINNICYLHVEAIWIFGSKSDLSMYQSYYTRYLNTD